MVPTVRRSQGKSRNFKQVRESQRKLGKNQKIRESRGILHSKVREDKRVRERQGKLKYQCAKVNKDAEKI